MTTVVAVGVFWGCLGVGYFADDFALLGAAADGVDWWGALPVGTGGYFRPLFLASFLVGDAPRLQHGLNLLLHLGNGLLLLGIGRLAGCRPALAGPLALVFLLHPLVTTNVYWLAGRADSLCALFYLAGVLAFLGHLRSGRTWLLGATAGALVLSVLAKETGLTLAPVLGALWLLYRVDGAGAAGEPAVPHGRLRSAGWGVVALGLLTALLAAFVATVFWRRVPLGTWQGPAGPVGVLVVAVNAVVLRIDEYDLRRWGFAYPALRWVAAGAGAAVAATVGVVAFRLGGRRGVLRLALLALLPLAPLTPLLAIGWARERHMYLPWALAVVAVAVALGGGSGRLWGPAGDRPGRRPQLQRLAAGVALLVVPLLAWASLARGGVWGANAAYLERSCQSFRARIAAAPMDLPVLLVTFPFSRAEVPLYSNDPWTTLHHCVHGTFGRLERLHVYAGVGVEAAERDPHEVVESSDRPAERTFARRTEPREAYFRFLPDHRPGPHRGDELAELRVERIEGSGDVTAFELSVEPGARGVVLDLGPEGWRRLY